MINHQHSFCENGHSLHGWGWVHQYWKARRNCKSSGTTAFSSAVGQTAAEHVLFGLTMWTGAEESLSPKSRRDFDLSKMLVETKLNKTPLPPASPWPASLSLSLSLSIYDYILYYADVMYSFLISVLFLKEFESVLSLTPNFLHIKQTQPTSKTWRDQVPKWKCSWKDFFLQGKA